MNTVPLTSPFGGEPCSRPTTVTREDDAATGGPSASPEPPCNGPTGPRRVGVALGVRLVVYAFLAGYVVSHGVPLDVVLPFLGAEMLVEARDRAIAWLLAKFAVDKDE